MKRYFLIAALMIASTISAQTRLDTFRVYFAINDTSLNKDAIETLSALSLKSGTSANDTLVIMGYADMLGNDLLNNRLSAMRAERVKEFLLGNSVQKTTIKLCVGKGAVERKDTVLTKEGFAPDRRVDIIAPRGIIIRKKTVSVVEKGKPFEPDTFVRAKKGDLFLLSKVFFLINRHTYEKSSEKELEELYELLAKNTSIRIKVEGHVCCMPPGHDGEDFDVPKELTREDMRGIIYQKTPKYFVIRITFYKFAYQ